MVISADGHRVPAPPPQREQRERPSRVSTHGPGVVVLRRRRAAPPADPQREQEHQDVDEPVAQRALLRARLLESAAGEHVRAHGHRRAQRTPAGGCATPYRSRSGMTGGRFSARREPDAVAMIEATGLTKRLGGRAVVSDVSFRCEPGTVTGFLGPNGAGKTTTMRMLVGLSAPDGGSATVLERPYTQLQNPGLRVGVLLDASAQHPGRRGREALAVSAQMMGVPDARVDELLGLVGLDASAAGMLAARHVHYRGNGDPRPDPRSHRHGRREPHLVGAVVDAHPGRRDAGECLARAAARRGRASGTRARSWCRTAPRPHAPGRRGSTGGRRSRPRTRRCAPG